MTYLRLIEQSIYPIDDMRFGCYDNHMTVIAQPLWFHYKLGCGVDNVVQNPISHSAAGRKKKQNKKHNTNTWIILKSISTGCASFTMRE